jgi:hypothetical protein
MGLLGPFKGHEDAPWRGLSVCCAETRLGVGLDIAQGVFNGIGALVLGATTRRTLKN